MAGDPVQVVRVEVTLNPSAGSREKIMNVWHIASVAGSTTLEAVTAFKTDLQAFYSAIDADMSDELSGSVPFLRGFDLSEPEPRQPIYESSLSALVTSDSRTARELCICLSYKGNYVSGTSPKRMRGRIYLGPWSSGLMNTDTGKLDSTLKGHVVTAGQALFDAADSDIDYSWVVYSPTTDTAGTGSTGATRVTSAWVDDEVDIQRRRGMVQPGTKTLIT